MYVVPRDLLGQVRAKFAQTADAARLVRLVPGNGWELVLRVPTGELLASGTATKAVAMIEAQLARLPGGTLTESDWALFLPPVGLNGFAIDVSRSGHQIRVLFGGLEEEFDSLADALPWVRRALSNTYQLKTTMVGGLARGWRLEPAEDLGEMAPVLAVSFGPLLPAWIRPRKHILQRNAFPL